MARFVIANFTDPKIILQEVPHIAQNIAVPIIPIQLKNSSGEPVTLSDLRRNYKWVAEETYWYTSNDLIQILKEKIIPKAIEMASGGINLSTDSLAYSVIVANPNVTYIIPEDFPRNVVVMKFTYFQILFVYWLFNFPTKFRCSIIHFTTSSEKYKQGFEFHEILNFTNDITLLHMEIYMINYLH